MVTVKSQYLPFTSCMWVTENSLVTAGYDNLPLLFSFDGGTYLPVSISHMHRVSARRSSLSFTRQALIVFFLTQAS